MAEPDQKRNERPLTSIPEGIHCAATPEDQEDNDELDEIAIENFLDILAEVALAVARRRKLGQ